MLSTESTSGEAVTAWKPSKFDLLSLANHSFICLNIEFLCYANKGTPLSLTTFMFRLNFMTNLCFKSIFQWEICIVG